MWINLKMSPLESTHPAQETTESVPLRSSIAAKIFPGKLEIWPTRNRNEFAIPTRWQSSLRASRRAKRVTNWLPMMGATSPQLCLGGVAASRAGRRGLARSAPPAAARSRSALLLPDGPNMTAEIAVMNKGAIALAADSKVTIGGGSAAKTYDTVNKLFTLSKVAPVGVMIYGNAEFMSYPWETIIKIYRQKKGMRTERLIVDWANDFFRFLDSFGDITPGNRNYNLWSICNSVITDALERFSALTLAEGISPTTPEYEKGLEEYFKALAKRVVTQKPWGTKRQQESLLKASTDIITKAVQRHLKKSSIDVQNAALLLVVSVIAFEASSPQMSGVVIAGFGDDEYFPTLLEYSTDGYVGKRIKRFQIGPDVDLSRENAGCVRAFAQKEMVQRFMDGIDPSYSSFIMNGIQELVVDNCFTTLEKYGTRAKKTGKVRDDIKNAVTSSFNDFRKQALEFRQGRFSDPVMGMVALLPKDELANLAESLVALTSLKRRVSSDAETVGGPIDVALISKGDGFVWIKRKLYFPAELNPQFVRTYMDDVRYGERDNGTRGPSSGRRGASKASPSRGSKSAGRAKGGQGAVGRP